MKNEFLGHMSGVKSLSVNEKEKVLVSGAKDGSGRVWDLDQLAFKGSLNGHRDNLCSIAFTKNSRVVATGAWD